MPLYMPDANEIRIYSDSEVRPFDPRIDNGPDLQAVGLIPVGSIWPTDTIRPGIQVGMEVDDDDHVVVDRPGWTIGERNVPDAAAQIIIGRSYDAGLRTGHAGIHGNRTSGTEHLASELAKAVVSSHPGRYVGYLLMAKETHFDGVSPANSPIIKGRAPVEEVVGVTLSDLDRLMAPAGINGLRDPIEVPKVLKIFRQYGIRTGDYPEAD